MPRSGYSREDPVAKRHGYVSSKNDPVDHRGGTETHSGRINHARMNERASPDTFIPSLDPRSRGLHVPRGQLYSSISSNLSDIPSRDDLHRSEPSQEFERRTRGYNPGYFGERVPTFGSSPQLKGLDRGYRDEGEDWPRDSPIKNDFDEYKRVERRGKGQVEEYEIGEDEWDESRGKTGYLPPQLRDEDNFDQRQSLLAAEASRFFQSAGGRRTDHDNDYIGHWPRAKREGHEDAVPWVRNASIRYEKESRRHRDSRNDRWRDKWQSDLEEYYPEDDDY